MIEQNEKDIVIIGGGIVGLATAYQLSLRRDKGAEGILIVEKESSLAFHQTGHNSGVIHSGVYYKPGSLKSKNCNQGRKALVKFAEEHHIPHDICGKVIVASLESDIPHLEEIWRKANANEVEDIHWIDNNYDLRSIEPYCAGLKAIYVGCAGIINYKAVTQKLAELFKAKGGEIILNNEVLDIQEQQDYTLVIAQKGNYKAKQTIACAGAQCDRLARKHGIDPGMQIVGFRGEYYELINKDLLKHLIYPTPNPDFPWLGVHFTRMIDGSMECGPNAVFAFHREGYNKTDFKWKDLKAALSYKGFWKLTTRHLAYGVEEQYRSISKKAFYKSLLHLIPDLQMEDIIPGRSGVRALALDPNGDMIDDFKIVRHANALHVLNAPSPAATASLAVGEHIANMALQS